MSNPFSSPGNDGGASSRWNQSGFSAPDPLPPSQSVEPYAPIPRNTPARPVQHPSAYPTNPGYSQQPFQQGFGQVPQPVYGGATPIQYDASAPRKSKTVALVLSFPLLIGGFGLHNFYLGQTLRGVLHLVLLVLGLIPVIGWIAVIIPHLIWVTVEFILIIAGAGSYGVDKQGRPLV